jgi:hypothetical protein
MSRRSLRNYVMFLAAVSGLGLLAQAPAQAQDARAGKAQGPATAYAFDDHLVGGDGVAPDGEVLRVRPRKDRESLVRVRTDFLRELFKTVEDL